MLQIIHSLNCNLLDILEEDTNDLYLRGNTQPILHENGIYFTESNYYALIRHISETTSPIINYDSYRLKDFKTIISKPETIFDQTGNIVITATDLINYNKLLIVGSNLPIIGLRLVETIITEHLLQSLKKITVFRNYDLYNLIKPEYHYVINENILPEMFDKLLTQIDNWIGDDIWYMCFTKITSTTFIIEKICDYRVWDWHKIQEENLLKENGIEVY